MCIQGAVQRMYDGPADAEFHHEQVGMTVERPASAAVCYCHEEQPRWPHTCLIANHLSQSLSGMSSRVQVRALLFVPVS